MDMTIQWSPGGNPEKPWIYLVNYCGKEGYGRASTLRDCWKAIDEWMCSLATDIDTAFTQDNNPEGKTCH